MTRQPHSSQYSLNDLIQVIRSRKWTFVTVSIVSGILGAFVFQFTPKIWSVRVQVRVGQIQSLNTGSNGISHLIETPLKVARDISQEHSLNKVFSTVYPQDEPERERAKIIFLNSFNAYPPLDSDIVELKANALSAKKAEALIQSVISQIKQKHDPVFNAHQSRAERVLKLAQKGLETLQAQGKINTPERLLAQFTFEEKILALQDKMNPDLNYPTQTAGEIHLSDRAAQPKRILYITGFIIAGILIALLTLIYRKRV